MVTKVYASRVEHALLHLYTRSIGNKFGRREMVKVRKMGRGWVVRLETKGSSYHLICPFALHRTVADGP